MSAGRRAPPPFPLTVLTGFLGAGKTTVLNQLLVAPEFSAALVLINEIGEVGVDHLLVETIGDPVMVMPSGCLCCTLRGDFITALEDLLRRRDNGRIASFNRVVVETTGLADPIPFLHSILLHPYLKMRFSLEGVITAVDALTGDARLDDQFEAVRQAAVADRLVLTKTDLAAKSQVNSLRLRLRALNPSALVVEAPIDKEDLSSLVAAHHFVVETQSSQVKRWLNVEALSGTGETSARFRHGFANGAVSTRAASLAIQSFVLRSSAAMPAEALQGFLDLLVATHGPRLLRMKGIVRLSDDKERPLVIQGVQHVLYPSIRLSAWPDEVHETRIVCVVRDLDPEAVKRLWAAFQGLAGPSDVMSMLDPLGAARRGLLG